MQNPYLSTAEGGAINGQPGSIVDIYNGHRTGFLADLGTGFSGVDEPTLQAIFCMVAAFWTKGYGVPSPPISLCLAALANSPSLVCDKYCAWAYQLLQVLNAKAVAPWGPLTVDFLGWNGGVVANHAQLMVKGGAFSVLLDPTVGIAARTDYDSLLEQKPAAALADFWPSTASWAFHDAVKTALETGQYKPSDALYFYGTFEAFASGASHESYWPTPQNAATP